MASKLIILVLLTSVAQTCLAVDTCDSCVPNTRIEADLEIIQYGQDMSRHAYRVIMRVIIKQLLALIGRRYDNDCNTYSLDNAKNQSYVGLLMGNVPTLNALALISPDLNVSEYSKVTATALKVIITNIFSAIEAGQGVNCTESRGKIASLWNLAQGEIVYAIESFGAAAGPNSTQTSANGTVPAVITCVTKKVVANILAGYEAVYEGIYLLVDVFCNNRTDDDVEKCASELAAIRKKALKHFDAEINQKYSLIRNNVVSTFLEETGVRAGLFSLQAVSAISQDCTVY